MDPFDSYRLRAQDITAFHGVEAGITDVGTMDAFADTVSTNAVGAVREILHGFNETNFISRLPPEILAACFSHLPFDCRIFSSHVCRSWRAAALSAPELWSNMGLWPACGSPELLHMALSRSGSQPIDMNIGFRHAAAPEDFYAAIAPFSRRIRYLAWHIEHPFSGWEFETPNMEYFCASSTIAITGRFLGGSVGRLRHLYLQEAYLPDTCPVLSTVTDLNIVLTPVDEGTSPRGLANLFALFPRLEWLRMSDITDAHVLPAGPAPASLRDLALYSASSDFDLTPLYVPWDSGNFEHVSLFQYSGVLPNLERMANGAVRLAVKYRHNYSTTRVMFEHGVSLTLSISIPRLKITDAVASLAAVHSKMSNVHTAVISHTALRQLLDVLAALPSLEHLCVHIVPERGDGTEYAVPDPHSFVWSHLACLADAARGLRTVTLQVWCGNVYQPTHPNANDARGLLRQLRGLRWPIPPIEIQGFPADEVAGIDLTGLDVRFDFETPVGELRFHENREPWEPGW